MSYAAFHVWVQVRVEPARPGPMLIDRAQTQAAPQGARQRSAEARPRPRLRCNVMQHLSRPWPEIRRGASLVGEAGLAGGLEVRPEG
jgi:hypothetical protein